MSSSTDRYPIPAQRFRCEIEIERSRFITTLKEIRTEEEGQAFTAELKAEFPDANHNCWAYLIGPPGSSDRIGLSDDGEPHGVAGRPILTCLQHSGLGDTAAVVTRYFGGIKLGKGGMVKAYTAAVLKALDQLPRTMHMNWCELQATYDYALVSAFMRRLDEYEAEVLTIDYTDRVSCRLQLPAERAEGFRRMFADLSAGKALLVKTIGEGKT